MIFKHFKIRTKLLLSFSVTVLFLVSVAVIGITRINTIDKEIANYSKNNMKPLDTLSMFISEFTELRYQVTLIGINSEYQDIKYIEESVRNIQDQLQATVTIGQTYLNELIKIDVAQSRIVSVNSVLDIISNEYKYHINNICAAALNKDSKSVFEELLTIEGIAGGIFDTMNQAFANNSIQAQKSTEKVSQVANESKIIILLMSALSAIISAASAIYIGNAISKPVFNLREEMSEIAKGNFDKEIDSTAKDEIGDLARDLTGVRDMVKRITSSLYKLSNEFNEGDIEARIRDTGSLQGAYKETVDCINDMVDKIINETFAFQYCVSGFGDGNFDADVPKMPGKKGIMNETVDYIRGNLKAVSSEVNALVGAAADGNLSVRANSMKYKGDWAGIMNGLNRLMEAVANPIKESEDVLSRVSQGVFGYKVTGDYKGEFLRIKTSINQMAENMASYINEIATVLSELSNDNLDQVIEREYVGKFSEIKDAINNIITKFNQVISDISAAASQVAEGARQITDNNIMLAEGATEQAASVEELNATVYTINENTMQNAKNTKEAELLSESTKNNAARGTQNMNDMLKSMEGINGSSNQISKIIQAIDDIAFQTNLLALNAAVEAARAGVQGKGFAVVSEEVRNLAGRSKNAAKETAELIDESIGKVNDGTKTAEKTAEAFELIVNETAKVAELIASISVSSSEQANAMSQITAGIQQITNVVQSNSASSEEAAAAARELSSQAENLKNMVKVFRLKKD